MIAKNSRETSSESDVEALGSDWRPDQQELSHSERHQGWRDRETKSSEVLRREISRFRHQMPWRDEVSHSVLRFHESVQAIERSTQHRFSPCTRMRSMESYGQPRTQRSHSVRAVQVSYVVMWDHEEMYILIFNDKLAPEPLYESSSECKECAPLKISTDGEWSRELKALAFREWKKISGTHFKLHVRRHKSRQLSMFFPFLHPEFLTLQVLPIHNTYCIHFSSNSQSSKPESVLLPFPSKHSYHSIIQERSFNPPLFIFIWCLSIF